MCHVVPEAKASTSASALAKLLHDGRGAAQRVTASLELIERKLDPNDARMLLDALRTSLDQLANAVRAGTAYFEDIDVHRDVQQGTQPSNGMTSPLLPNSRTILVVEDDPFTRAAYVEALEALGHRVLDAGDAANALRCLADSGDHPDMVLTDVRLPDMDGRKLVDRVRRLYASTLPVIYVTGWQIDELSAGLEPLDRIFQKPVNLNLIERAVDDLFLASAARTDP